MHWPFCKSKCPYCDFNSHVREQVDHAAWKNALLQELDYSAALAGQNRLVTSVFFGGGTPSLMQADTVKAVLDRIADHWPLAADCEITLEANPTSVEAGNFLLFRNAGINRVSLGIQSLRQSELHFLGRQHNVSEACDAIALARDHFPRYTFDLIYARPQQTLGEWGEELDQALSLAGNHLSLYQLTIEENTAFHHAYYAQKKFTLPDEENAAALYEFTQFIMESHGLPAYEISNHARPGEESRHNLAYWKYEDYLGIGPGAHGRITLRDGSRIATQTLKSPELWLQHVAAHRHAVTVQQPLTRSEQIEEC